MGIPEKQKLAPGLYFVATPIGNARDITLRALDILASADVIAAEDTRSMRRLMDIHGVTLGDRPLISYHDHNGAKVRPKLLAFLAQGKSVAYGSEAGMPLIADPGFDLARAVVEEGFTVTTAPGASAVLTALSIAALPTDRFFFAGFLPNSKGQRKSALNALREVPGTLIFYESPRRVGAMLADAASALGGDRPAAICRELTKRFEECRRGTLSGLAEQLAGEILKGEVVVLIGQGDSPTVNDSDLEVKLKDALSRLSVRDASDEVSSDTGVARRRVYQLALKIDRES